MCRACERSVSCSFTKSSPTSIIAVHGLNGHAYGTWAFQEGKAGSEVMWLRDFLPDQVKNARITVYGYNSTLVGPNTSVSNVKDFACDLLQRILDDRKSASVGRHRLVDDMSLIADRKCGGP